MKVIHKHTIYLDRVQSNIYINAMQSDACTRVLEFSLYSGGVAWDVPEGAHVAVAYEGASGKGIYDTLPDGTVAYTVTGNVVTAVVTPQALAMYGETKLTVVFDDGDGHQLSTFCVTLKVERNPAVNAVKPPDYINLRQWMSEELIGQITQATAHAEEMAIRADEAADRAVKAGKPLTVTITTVDGVLTADKSYAEMYKAYIDDRAVVCKMGDRLMPLVSVANYAMEFQGVVNEEYQRIVVKSDNTVTQTRGQYALASDLRYEWRVSVSMQEDGSYSANKTVDEIGHATDAGYPVVCLLEVEGAYISLPLVRCDGTLMFTGIYEGNTYTVTINAEGVTVEISEVGGGTGAVPENVALLEDVTMDEASGDFIPMLSENGTEYRLSIGNDGIPVIKNLDGKVVWNGTSGGSSGGNTGGDSGGDTGDDNDDPTDNTEWVSGAEIAYTVIADEYPDKNDGSIKPDTSGGYDRTDYIYCYGAGMLWSTGGSAYNAWYDSAKQFISSFDTAYDGYQKVPENAVYMVCSAPTLDNFKCKLYKKVEPTWTDGVAYQFTFVENEYVSTKGDDTAYEGWKRTDFVNCAGVSKLSRSDGGGNITYAYFYNAEKEPMRQFTYATDVTEVTVPVGACYFKVSATNAIMDALVIVPHA